MSAGDGHEAELRAIGRAAELRADFASEADREGAESHYWMHAYFNALKVLPADVADECEVKAAGFTRYTFSAASAVESGEFDVSAPGSDANAGLVERLQAEAFRKRN